MRFALLATTESKVQAKFLFDSFSVRSRLVGVPLLGPRQFAAINQIFQPVAQATEHGPGFGNRAREHEFTTTQIVRIVSGALPDGQALKVARGCGPLLDISVSEFMKLRKNESAAYIFFRRAINSSL